MSYSSLRHDLNAKLLHEGTLKEQVLNKMNMEVQFQKILDLRGEHPWNEALILEPRTHSFHFF